MNYRLCRIFSCGGVEKTYEYANGIDMRVAFRYEILAAQAKADEDGRSRGVALYERSGRRWVRCSVTWFWKHSGVSDAIA